MKTGNEAYIENRKISNTTFCPLTSFKRRYRGGAAHQSTFWELSDLSKGHGNAAVAATFRRDCCLAAPPAHTSKRKSTAICVQTNDRGGGWRGAMVLQVVVVVLVVAPVAVC